MVTIIAGISFLLSVFYSQYMMIYLGIRGAGIRFKDDLLYDGYCSDCLKNCERCFRNGKKISMIMKYLLQDIEAI